MSHLPRKRVLRIIMTGCLLILSCSLSSCREAPPQIASVRVVPPHGEVLLGESVPLEVKTDRPDAPVTFKWVVEEGRMRGNMLDAPSGLYIPPNKVGTYLVRVQLFYRNKQTDEKTIPIKVITKAPNGKADAPPSPPPPRSAWFSGTTGSPHGDLPEGAQAVSPDGKFRAQLAGSGKQVELYDAKTNAGLGVISGDGSNPPKALAFSPDSAQLAVLYHHADQRNVIEIRSVETRQPLQSIPFTGQDYYHEIGYSPDGKHLGLRLQWKGLWAVINLATEQPREGKN